jgi:urea transport system ATP-binding protein
VLELTHVDAFYGNSPALQDVSFAVRAGEFVSVLGRNGVGKTTLMRAMLGLIGRTRGSIRLDGVEISRRPTHQRAMAGIGYVPQGRGILNGFTVLENLKMGGFTGRTRLNGNLERVLELFPVLKEHLDRLGGNLSGGQQQQLAIARALLAGPKVMLLDEPTEGIQPNIVEKIEQVLMRLNRDEGITTVLVEQNVAFARRASTAFLMMNRGTIAADGPISELTDDVVQRFMAV